MGMCIVVSPGDSMWWLLRPEFLAYVDRVRVDPADYARVESEKSDSGYHAAVWRRLSVLAANGVLDLSPVEVDWESCGVEAEQRLEKVLPDERLAEVFIADLIFVYRYWLEFNQQRLETLPVVDAYAQCVREHLPVWTSDLELLVNRGRQALLDQPKILQQTARSIVGRAVCLREVNRRYRGAAFASLRQFQPFVKYAECPQDFPPDACLEVFGVNGKDLPAARTINLPVEPDLSFLSHGMSKLDYWTRLSAIRSDYAGMRARLSSLGAAGVELIDNLRDGRLDLRAAQACAGLERELADLGSKIRAGSPYLREAFYGLCLVPTVALARTLEAVGEEGGRGAAPPPGKPDADLVSCPEACGYYAIQESLLDLSRVECPRRVKIWRKAGSPKRYTFWRAADY
jgi:hypothetical protein